MVDYQSSVINKINFNRTVSTNIVKRQVTATLFFKCHFLGHQAKSDAPREVFLTKVTLRVSTKLLGKLRWFFLHILFKQTYKGRITILRPQLTVVFVRHQQLASLQNQKELVTSIFVILCIRAKSKTT
jgi:hypothetical protein